MDLAVNVNGSGVAAFDFSAGARVTFMDVAHRGGEWRNDLLFGSSNLGGNRVLPATVGVAIFCRALCVRLEVCPQFISAG